MTFSHRWTGWNGDVFELTPGGAGTVWLNTDGVVGLGAMEVDQFVRKSPALSGQRLTGVREFAREVFWPLVIDGSDGSWAGLQESFRRTLRPDLDGVWRVTAADDSYRELSCRYVPSPDAYRVDPSFAGVEDAAIDMVADDPWWRGPEFTKTFQTAGDQLPFFAVTSDRVFNIMSSNTVASATVTNDGEVPAWPKYTITGPVSSFSATISGGKVSSVTDVIAGATLVIDTDPTVQRAILTVSGVDTNVTRDLVDVDWRSVPAGGSVTLDITLNGPGSIAVSLYPRYYRAW